MNAFDDRERVTTLLGREPQGAFTVVVRDREGDPVVIRNAPLLDDGTPMPTRYWLIGPEAVRRVGRLEAAGGVRSAELALDPSLVAAAHDRYAAERNAALDAAHSGPLPSGGVGGTRTGVKCLHAHYAWHLAGGDDPVGHWVAERLAEEDRTLEVELGEEQLEIRCAAGWHESLPVGWGLLLRDGLDTADPPTPASLTNALGLIDDLLADLTRRRGEMLADVAVRFTGELAETIGRVELGRDQTPDPMALSRDAAEDVYRTVVTESHEDRAHNPGLPPQHVAALVPASCLVVAVMRRFGLETVTLVGSGDR